MNHEVLVQMEMPDDAVPMGTLVVQSYMFGGGEQIGVIVNVGEGMGTLEAIGLMELAKLQYMHGKGELA